MHVDQFPPAPKMPAGVQIMAVPVVSTAHITAKDRQSILFPGPEILAIDADGHLSFISFEGDYRAPQEFEEDFPPKLYSDEFRALLCVFAALGYEYLRLDADAEIIEGLPVFDVD